MTFEALVAIASAVSAAIATVLTALSSMATSKAAERQFENLKKVRVDEVLGNPSVRSLGGLLVDDLGKTSLPSYVRDPRVRAEFRRTFVAVREFVGTDVELLDEERSANGRQDAEEAGVEWKQMQTPVGQKAIRELNSGETWNALALMRREIETVLAELMSTSEDGRPRGGAGRLAGLAAKQGIITQQVAAALRYPISVANAAVHGEEVSPDAAIEAIFSMDRAISEISDTRT